MNKNSFIQFQEMIQKPLFLCIYLGLCMISYFFLDRPIAIFFHQYLISDHINFFVYFFNNFGLGGYYLIGFPIVAFIYFKYLKKPEIAFCFVFLWLSVIFSGIICDILKVIFGRARPYEFFDHQYYGFYWFKFNCEASFLSFPSGHSTTITSVMAALSYFKPRYALSFMLFALIISLMRVVLVKHYLSDVIAGVYLALICNYCLYKIFLIKIQQIKMFN